MDREKILKWILWYVVAFHSILSLAGIFAKAWIVPLAAQFFNFNLQLTDQFMWVLNPFSAYGLAFAGFMAVAATNPKKYTKIIYVGAGLLLLRVLQRIIFYLTGPEQFVGSASWAANLTSIVFIAVLATVLIHLARKIDSE